MMSKKAAFAALVAGFASSVAFADPVTLPRVSSNAALKATPSGQYPLGVMRYGFTSGGDVAPLMYKPSNSACSLNGGLGDNGSQVKSADNKCWLAVFDATPVDIMEFGAKCDGATDDSAIIATADASTVPALSVIKSSCVVNANTTIVHRLYVGSQGSLAVQSGKVLTIASVIADTPNPFTGSGTVSVNTTTNQIVRNLAGVVSFNPAAVDTTGGGTNGNAIALFTPILGKIGGFTHAAGIYVQPSIGGSGFGIVLAAASVATGGSGCSSGVQTFTISGGTGTSATVTGTVTAGVLGGALTSVNSGFYSVAPGSPATLTGGGCSVAPTANIALFSSFPAGVSTNWGTSGSHLASSLVANFANFEANFFSDQPESPYNDDGHNYGATSDLYGGMGFNSIASALNIHTVAPTTGSAYIKGLSITMDCDLNPCRNGDAPSQGAYGIWVQSNDVTVGNKSAAIYIFDPNKAFRMHFADQAPPVAFLVRNNFADSLGVGDSSRINPYFVVGDNSAGASFLGNVAPGGLEFRAGNFPAMVIGYNGGGSPSAGPLTLNNAAAGVSGTAGELGMRKLSGGLIAPGSGFCKIGITAGSVSGSALFVRCGSSATVVIVADNIPET